MKTISTKTDYKCVEKRATGRMGLGCIPIEALASWIHFLQQTQSLALIHTDRQTHARAHKPDQMPQNHHTMQEGMIQYVTTQILHTLTITESYHNIRALPAFKLAAFTKKGKEIASCERDICHWPSEGGECSLWSPAVAIKQTKNCNQAVVPPLPVFAWCFWFSS